MEDAGKVLFDRLRRISSDIRVGVYFGSPADYFLSAALQTLKAAQVIKGPSRQSAKGIVSSHLPLTSQPTIREYKRDQLVNGDISDDFIHAVNPELDGVLTKRGRQKNESLSAEVMEILRQYRASVWPEQDNKFNDETDLLLEHMVAVAKEHGLYRRPQLRHDLRRYLNALTPDTEWMKSEFGFQYSSADYTETDGPATRPEREYKLIRDICKLDQQVMLEIAARTIGVLAPGLIGETAVQPTQAEPVAKRKRLTTPKFALSTEERQRLSDVQDRLRTPEFEVYCTPGNRRRFDQNGRLFIRHNFDGLPLKDIENWAIDPQRNVVLAPLFQLHVMGLSIRSQNCGRQRARAALV